jgi:hypothetical protein
MIRLAALGVMALGFLGVGRQAQQQPATKATEAAKVKACVRLEHEVGQLPLEVRVGDQTVRFVQWKAADEKATELIGFTAEIPSEVHWTVEAGNERFDGNGDDWLNPHGVVGPKVKPIRAMTLCAN